MIRIYQIMHYLVDMFNTIYDWWNIVMNSERNPLKNIQDLHVRHLIMQILAWMWCIIFSLWIGSIWVFGFTAVLHLLLIFLLPFLFIPTNDNAASLSNVARTSAFGAA